LFAFGFARLGEAEECRRLLKAAAADLLNRPMRDKPGQADPAHGHLYAAFEYRVQQVLAGKPHGGPFPPEMLARLDELDRANRQSQSPSMVRYVVDRMCEQSAVLDPQEKVNPYRKWKNEVDDLLNGLKELVEIGDPGRLRDRIRVLFGELDRRKAAPELRVRCLVECLSLAPRAGEKFAADLVRLVPKVLDAVAAPADADGVSDQARILERALFLAGHFDQADLIPGLVERFERLLRSLKGELLAAAINLAAGQCLRSLRKLGMRDTIHELLALMQVLVTQGKTLAQLRGRPMGVWYPDLQSLVHVAGGWLYFGLTDKAMPILDEARQALVNPDPALRNALAVNSKHYAHLAQAYAAALGQGPVDLTLARMQELFLKMHPLPNSYSSAQYYSRFHLNIVEDAVLALVSDDFALGPAARRWLDDDEYLVRRRIHADVQQLRQASGV
jgi:hypothetical protein